MHDAGVRPREADDHVEAGRLAGAVRPEETRRPRRPGPRADVFTTRRPPYDLVSRSARGPRPRRRSSLRRPGAGRGARARRASRRPASCAAPAACPLPAAVREEHGLHALLSALDDAAVLVEEDDRRDRRPPGSARRAAPGPRVSTSVRLDLIEDGAPAGRPARALIDPDVARRRRSPARGSRRDP